MNAGVLYSMLCSSSACRSLDDVDKLYIYRKFSFSQRTTNEWNQLCADCANVTNVNKSSASVSTWHLAFSVWITILFNLVKFGWTGKSFSARKDVI